MARPRRFPHPPITEAIIDIQAQPSSGFRVEELEVLQAQISDRFPLSKRQWLLESVLVKSGEPGQLSAGRKSLRGLTFRSKDSLNVAQLRLDGFTYSRLRPYTKWETVFDEAWDLWKRFREISSPTVVPRIAVRYINRIELPPPIDFSRYLEAPPTVPEGVPNRVNTFLSRVAVYDPKTEIATNITQAIEKGIDPERVILLLDIDSHIRRDFDSDDADIKSKFMELREMKNRIFFASITEETARMFD